MHEVPCVLCRGRWITVRNPICHTCRERASNPESIRQILSDLGQHRMVMAHRFADSKRFLELMRSTAKTAGFAQVEGPCAVEIIGQRSEFDRGPIAAYEFTRQALNTISFGEFTDVRAVHVALTKGGNLWTEIAVRSMLTDEVYGVGGVTR